MVNDVEIQKWKCPGFCGNKAKADVDPHNDKLDRVCINKSPNSVSFSLSLSLSLSLMYRKMEAREEE